jgi:protocatechuate 3,4-dioxygenase beta subunit
MEATYSQPSRMLRFTDRARVCVCLQPVLRLSGRVLSAQGGAPVAGAVLDVWHSDDQVP